MCKACNKIITAGKSELQKHAATDTHVKKAKASTSSVCLDKFVKKNTQSCIEAELRYAVLAAEYNLSFRVMEQIIALSQDIFNDSRLSPEIQVKRSKCTYLIKNVLSENIRRCIDNDLQHSFFSILIDETTDVSNDKNLCILVKYYKDDSIKTHLLDILKISADGATAKNMYKLFVQCLKNHNLNVSKIVGYCSDNANVMLGRNESFMTYLLKDNPNIFVLGCICHSAHLIASSAADVLPKNVEGLMHSIYSYFSRSPRRQSILEGIQTLMNKEKHKMINPSRTRWLALLNAINRILEQWETLQQTFLLASVEDKNPSADLILRDLNNPFTRAYFQFMAHVLPLFNNFNKLFQSDSILIGYLEEESRRFLRLICANFLRPKAFENIYQINPKSPDMLLSLEEINIGFAAKTTLSTIVNQNNDILEFKLRCMKFYQVAVEETIKRLPVHDKLIAELKFLHPTVALRSPNRPNLEYICNKYSNIITDKNSVLTEWEMLKYYFEGPLLEQLCKKSIVEFWYELSKTKTFNNEWPFKNLCQVASIALSLPHSNAEVERVFSLCTDTKTKKRNRLNTETLCAILRVKLDLKNTHRTCRNYPINKNHYDLFRNNLYQK